MTTARQLRRLGRCFTACAALYLAAATPASGMNADERMRFADGLYRRGLYEMAAPEYQSVLSDTNAADARSLAAFRLGECHRSLSNLASAAEAYDTVVREFPASASAPRAAFRRAEIDWQEGRLLDGFRRFAKVIASSPPDDIAAASLYHHGLCAAGIDRYADAETSFRSLLEKYPGSPYAGFSRMALANVLETNSGKPGEILSLLEAVMEKPETPALGAEAAARAGLLLYRDKKSREAADVFAKLARLYPDSPWVARTRLEAGWSFLLAGDIKSARATASVGLDTADAAARPAWLYFAANVERRDGKTEKALKRYDELIRVSPGHELIPAAAFEACSLAFKAGDYAHVLDVVDLTAATGDQRLQVAWMKAMSLQELGRAEEARDVFGSIAGDASRSDLVSAAAYQLALLRERSGDLSGAAAEYEAVAAKDPKSGLAADAWFAAGSAYLRAGNREKAVGAWTSLADRFPKHPRLDEALINRARLEIELGRADRAAATLDGLIDREPAGAFRADALYLRGTLFEEAGDFAGAERAYVRCIDQKPPEALARQVQFRRVAVLQRQGRTDDAASLMNTLLAAGEGRQLPSPLLEWLARWNLERGQDAEAAAAAVLLAGVGESDGWRQLGSYIEGVAAVRLGQADRATAAFTRAAGFALSTRETADACYQLGLLYLAATNHSDAEAWFTRAAEVASTDAAMDLRARSYLELGRLYEAKGNWADAGRYYLGVGVLFDDPVLTPESLYLAAVALEAQQKMKERDRVVAELRQRYPESEWAKRAGERWSGTATTGGKQ